MKRVKVVIVLFICLAAAGIALLLGLLAKMMGLVAKLLTMPAKLLVDTAIAIQWAAIDLSNTIRGWMRWAVR